MYSQIIGQSDLNKYKREHLIGVTSTEGHLNVWFNGEPFHVELCALTIAQASVLGGKVSLYGKIPLIINNAN